VSDRWTDTPPVPCHITGRIEAKPGQPYLVEEYLHSPAVAAPDGKNLMPAPRLRPLVHAASQIRRVCELPGSPFVLLTREEAAEQEAIRKHRDELLSEVEELTAELETLRSNTGAIDVQALANGLVIQLDERYARKAGRKPGPKAAA